MSLKPSKFVMQAAIKEAELNQVPYGASLAMGDQVFAVAADQTKQKKDPTAHASITVIRNLAGQIKKSDLSGFTLYTTCVPCLMCMGAIIGSGIETLVYGCGMPVQANHLHRVKLRLEEILTGNLEEIEVHKNFMQAECEALVQKFS